MLKVAYMLTNWKLWRTDEVHPSTHYKDAMVPCIDTHRSSPDRKSGLLTDLQCMRYASDYTHREIVSACDWVSTFNISITTPAVHFMATKSLHSMHPLTNRLTHTFCTTRTTLWRGLPHCHGKGVKTNFSTTAYNFCYKSTYVLPSLTANGSGYTTTYVCTYAPYAFSVVHVCTHRNKYVHLAVTVQVAYILSSVS